MTTSAYSYNASGTFVIRASDGVRIPLDPNNSDFQAVQLWESQGNTIGSYAGPAPVPTLTFLQFMALFSPALQEAIVGSSDVQVKLFVTMAAGSGGLQLNNPAVIQGIEYLATPTTASPPGPGILTSAQASQLLAGQALSQ